LDPDRHPSGSILALRLSARILVAAVRALASVALHSSPTRTFTVIWLETLGPTFIKIGQILSCRPDLIGDALTARLRRLQDRIAPVDWRIVAAQVEQSLGCRLEEAFRWFDPVPVSSASVAVVHRAQLWSGHVVAVKVRRPGIEKMTSEDLEALRWMAGWLERLPTLRNIPVRGTIEEFGRILSRQLDFRAEAQNLVRFRRNFLSAEGIRFPEPVLELCTEAVLTMEYFDDLRNFGDLKPSSETAAKVAHLTLRALFQMIFSDGFIHADMHFGNVQLRGDDELVMLDAGLAAELAPVDQKNFATFFFGMVCNKGKECARILYETASFRAAGFRRDAFDADVAALVDRNFAKSARDFEVTRFSASLFLILRQHGLRGSTTFMTTILSLVVFEGVVKQIDPALDFQAEARKYLPLVVRALFPPARPITKQACA
jgi:ubiquinone biosynthesis protein